ncbi:MAG: tRNA lysidine(34) synthetase TilS [Thermoleophilia bacterium]
MSALESRVAGHCRRHDLLPAGLPVLALVSGGPDSMCMLDVLLRVHDGPVGVLSMDHGLRAAAAGEVGMVTRHARAAGCAVHTESLAVAAGPGLQERARDARLACATRVAAEHGYARIAVGHTASDQAETVLFRIARGTGRAGAAGMAPRRGPFVRPLLCVSRAQTRAWCLDRGIPVVDDPSNDDRAFGRVRVRHDLLPALEGIHPDAHRHVAHLAELLRDEGEVLAPLIDEAWARCARHGGLDAGALAAEPAAMARLLVRRLVAEARLPAAAGERVHVERALDVAREGGRVTVPGGGGLARERGTLVAFGPAAADPEAVELPVPGSARCGGYDLHAAPGRAGHPRPDEVAVTVDGPFEVRPPRSGDRLSLPGGGRRAVGRLLADAGVAARLRPQVPVVATGDRVVWVVGHRAAADMLAVPGSPALVLRAGRAA